jgi:hypothetical protein
MTSYGFSKIQSILLTYFNTYSQNLKPLCFTSTVCQHQDLQDSSWRCHPIMWPLNCHTTLRLSFEAHIMVRQSGQIVPCKKVQILSLQYNSNVKLLVHSGMHSGRPQKVLARLLWLPLWMLCVHNNPFQNRYTTAERQNFRKLKEFRNTLLVHIVKLYTDHKNLTRKI